MALYEIQKQVYENKLRRKFNVTDVGKEVVLMSEEFGELCDAHIEQDSDEIVDALGDLMVYCLGLSSMFEWDADEILNKSPDYRNPPKKISDCIPYVGRAIGRIAKNFKKSNKGPVATIDMRDDFRVYIGELMGYCVSAFEVINVDYISTLENILQNNQIRTHEGQI